MISSEAMRVKFSHQGCLKALWLGVTLVLAGAVQADTYYDGNRYWGYRVMGDGVELVTLPDGACAVFPQPSGALEIPALIAGKPVLSIGELAFANCTELTSVVLPGSHLKAGCVTNIAPYAFFACEKLESVQLPDGLVRLGESAFSSCESLKSVTVPHRVKRIEDRTFCRCHSLAEVKLPDGVTSIGEDAFYECRALTSLDLPYDLTEIGPSSFGHCTSLKTLTLPYGVRKIPDHAFAATGLESIVLPPGVYGIGPSSFWSCKSLKKIYVGKGCKGDIKTLMDQNASGLDTSGVEFVEGVGEIKKITIDGIEWSYRVAGLEAEIYNVGVQTAIPNTTAGAITIPSAIAGYTVKRIGAGAFRYCRNLTSVFLPSKLISIGPEAFYFCTAMTKCPLPNSVYRFGVDAFRGCQGLADAKGFVIRHNTLYRYSGKASGALIVPAAVLDIGEAAFAANKKLTSVSIRGVSIGALAFNDCPKLKEVSIGDSVSIIGTRAFDGCSALKTVKVTQGRTAMVKRLLKASGLKTSKLKFVEEGEPRVCMLTLDPNKGTILVGAEKLDFSEPCTLHVDYGSTFGKLKLPKPKRKGYRFAGWFTAKGGQDSTQVSPNQKLTTAVTYYALWMPNKYTVKFYKNGGTGKMDPVAATYGKSFDLPANKFSNNNGKFLGWATSADATTEKFTNKETVKNLSSKHEDTVKLYAVWDKYTYSVAFDANGGKGEAATQTINRGESTALSKNVFTYEGFKFAGWAETRKGAVAYKNKAKVKNLAGIDMTKTLYAVWYPADWAVGTFTGPAELKGKKATATLTVAKNGTISGKFVRTSDKKSFPFMSSEGFINYFRNDAYPEGVLHAVLEMKYGSKYCVLDIFMEYNGEKGVGCPQLYLTVGFKEDIGSASLSFQE